MAFIHTTPPRNASGEVQAMYQRQQAGWGYVPNYAKVFSHRPPLMQRWADLLAGARQHMDSRRFELVTLAAAHALRNSYCSLAHARKLCQFLSREEVRQIVEDEAATPLSAAEAEMVAFARRVASDAHAITADEVSRLRAHGFSDAEIFDIAAVAAARSFLAKLCDALGVEPDSEFMAMHPELRRSLIVGRPIDDGPAETVAEPAADRTGRRHQPPT